MEIIDALKKFGLSEKESQVYLANLELGSSTAGDISIKSNLPRTLVYDILERLIKLGLISYSKKLGKKFFTSSEPKEFFRILTEKEEAMKIILPRLEELNKSPGVKRPQVEIYEGIEGMKTMMGEILNADIREFYGYGSSRSSYELIPAFMDEWHKERIKKKIIMNVLYNNTRQTKEKLKNLPKTLKYMFFKLMPIELESPTAIVIYSDKVVLQSWTKEPFAVVIESEQMAANQVRYFKELWKIAKK
jgi:sugar-specific transcriptional regulator TrmB